MTFPRNTFQSVGAGTYTGNIDLANRKKRRNPNGSYSTLSSASYNIDGEEVLLPTVDENGQTIIDPVKHYRETGQHLGKFNSIEEANTVAERLHEEQARIYDKTEPKQPYPWWKIWLDNLRRQGVGAVSDITTSTTPLPITTLRQPTDLSNVPEGLRHAQQFDEQGNPINAPPAQPESWLQALGRKESTAFGTLGQDIAQKRGIKQGLEAFTTPVEIPEAIRKVISKDMAEKMSAADILNSQPVQDVLNASIIASGTMGIFKNLSTGAKQLALEAELAARKVPGLTKEMIAGEVGGGRLFREAKLPKVETFLPKEGQVTEEIPKFKTGQSVEVTLYRGGSHSDPTILPKRTDFGAGEYWSPQLDVAKSYTGESGLIDKMTTTLKKPLYIREGTAGWKNLEKVAQEGGITTEEQAKAMSDYVKKQGHDALVVRRTSGDIEVVLPKEPIKPLPKALNRQEKNAKELTALIEAEQAKGKVPPVEPPKVPPTATAASPFEEAKNELVTAIKTTRETLGVTQALRTEELAKRFAKGSEILAASKGDEAFQLSKGALAGELPAIKPANALISPKSYDILVEAIRAAPESVRGIEYTDKLHAYAALRKFNGLERPAPSEMLALEKIIGKDVTRALEEHLYNIPVGKGVNQEVTNYLRSIGREPILKPMVRPLIPEEAKLRPNLLETRTAKQLKEVQQSLALELQIATNKGKDYTNEALTNYLRSVDPAASAWQLGFTKDLTTKVGVKASSITDKIVSWFYNAVLSSPKTHIVNTLSNTLNAFFSPVERFVSATIETPLAILQRRPIERFFGEVPADVIGAVQGLPEGVRSFLAVMKTGKVPEEFVKNWEYKAGAFSGKAGKVIEFPSLMLKAADSLMFAVNYRAALNATAYRIAAKAKLGGRLNTMAELLASPTKELVEEAIKQARYRIFAQEPGKILSSFMTFRNRFLPFRFILPFIQTPTNLIKYGLERSPLGLFNPSLTKNLIAKSPEAADNLARWTIGSAVAGSLALMFADGRITGAVPTNPSDKARFYRDGKQPFSIKLGDTWIAYQRLEPFNQVLSQVASVVETIRNREDLPAKELADAVTATMTQNLVSQTYLSNISSFLDALSDPERNGVDFIDKYVASLVPYSSALRTTTQITDPTIRQPEGLVERVKAGIPGLSRQVPARLGAFGEEQKREGAAWFPVTYTTEKASAESAPYITRIHQKSLSQNKLEQEVNKLKEQGKLEEAQLFIINHPEFITNKVYERVLTNITKLEEIRTKTEVGIINKELTPEERTRTVTELNQQIYSLATAWGGRTDKATEPTKSSPQVTPTQTLEEKQGGFLKTTTVEEIRQKREALKQKQATSGSTR